MTGAAVYQSRFHVGPDHPALKGHFPGDPMLPGVVVLDRVLTAAEDWLGADWWTGDLPQVKFISPMRPGDEAIITLVLGADRAHFTVRCRDATVAQGILKRAPREGSS